MLQRAILTTPRLMFGGPQHNKVVHDAEQQRCELRDDTPHARRFAACRGVGGSDEADAWRSQRRRTIRHARGAAACWPQDHG